MTRFDKHHELNKRRVYDFRLNDLETQRLQQHDFVVSERLGVESFAKQYYGLYSDDMPVFVTSDSVLHAWHRSFDTFLMHVEENGLQPQLHDILEKARSTLSATVDTPGLAGAMRDVDTYLAVAQCLLEGKTSATDALDAAAETTLVRAVNRRQLGTGTLFSCPPRDVDYSLFTPRGHYTKSTLLRQCFKAMTWLGTIDFRIDGTDDAASNQRQLQCACVLIHVLREADVMVSVGTIQSAVSTIAGDGFGADSMTFSKLVFDQVLHDGAKVARRIPSAVDAAFALFGNVVAGQVIAHRMQATSETSEDFVSFRDGLPYASNLLAMRRLVDAQLADLDPKTCSLALLWQLALRELSAKSASDADVFQSDAWQRRLMNTQIASLTQLRHDTILYAKQGSTLKMHYGTARRKSSEHCHGVKTVIGNTRSSKMRSVFTTFTDVANTLEGIAVTQSLKQELTLDQDQFLKEIIERDAGSGRATYSRWYPSLFYGERVDAGEQDHLVVDVHTDAPSSEHGDPGGILHLGVGDVNLGFFIVHGVMYAGPVFSTYEFVTKTNERLTDEEFSDRVKTLWAPMWASESFLVDDAV